MNRSLHSILPDRIFITGTGTDVGKSYATGWLARTLAEEGIRVITQKFIQTGNKGGSEDIEVHRRVMRIPLQPRDKDLTTAPIIMSYPASPHLAAAIDSVKLDLSLADRATEKLREEYDTVLIEGAGGVMVPLTEDYLTLDYISDRRLPAIVVTNGQLGSINHTLLTLHALRSRGIDIPAVIYNPYFDNDKIIAADTVEYIRRYLERNYRDTMLLEMPSALL